MNEILVLIKFLLKIVLTTCLRKVNNFCFFFMWFQDSSCIKLINDSWANTVVGCSMFILQHKLKRLKIELRVWKKNSFGNVHNVVLFK